MKNFQREKTNRMGKRTKKPGYPGEKNTTNNSITLKYTNNHNNFL